MVFWNYLFKFKWFYKVNVEEVHRNKTFFLKQWVSITFILLTTNFHNIFEFKNTDLKFSRNFASFLTLFIATELLRTKLVCVHRVRSHRKFFYIYIHMLVVVLYEIFRTMFWIELICHRMRRIHRFCALAKVIHPKYS